MKIVLAKQVVAYISYLAIVCLTQIILISLVSFFHFLLDHDLSTVDEWIWDYGWELVLTTKAIAFIMFSSLLIIDQRQENKLKVFIKSWNIKITEEIWAITLALLGIIFYWHYPLNINNTINVYRAMVSLVGGVTFFGIDLLVMVLINELWSYKGKLKLPMLLLFTGLFYFFSKVSFPFISGMGELLLFYYLLGGILAIFVVPNISWVLLFLLIAMVPHLVLIGPDLIWGKQFSIFHSGQSVGLLELVTVSVAVVFYIMIRKQRILNKLRV